MRQWRTHLGIACSCVILVSALWVGAQAPDDHTHPESAVKGTDGVAIYNAHCANCHGASGRGDGPAASLLTVRPRDFTTGRYKLRTTESGALPTDDDLFKTIRAGMHGSSMPDWGPFFTEEQLQAVVSHIKTFSPRFASETPQPISVVEPPPSTADSVKRGQAVFQRLQCASCHGTDGSGHDAVATDLRDDHNFPITATTLTEPWTFRGGATARDIYLRLRTGMNGTPMPSFKEAATDAELGHLANYVVSLARKPIWEMNADEVRAFYQDLDRREQSDKVWRGRYLVNTLGCLVCHAPVDDDGLALEGLEFAGGQRWTFYPFTEVVSYNLTSDRETGLGAWSDDQIKTALTRGIRPDGSRMLPFPMPWPAYGNLKPHDVDAIVAALRTIPPVRNAIPAPNELSLLPYLWGKFQVLILHRDIPGRTYPGNAGTRNGERSWQTP